MYYMYEILSYAWAKFFAREMILWRHTLKNTFDKIKTSNILSVDDIYL